MGGTISSFLSPDTIRPILSFVGGEAKYIWGLKGNLDDLQTQKENLVSKKRDLLNKVKAAEQQQPRARRTSTVKLWFERVDRRVTKVERLQQERDQEVDRLCLGGFCSKDLISSYSFGRKVEKMKNKVIELKKEGEAINELYEEVPEGAAVAIAVERTIVGQELILDQVWRCITDREKNNGIIGLYGTGGVGKTTLLKQVNNKFCSEKHDFDVVIWSVVSRELNLNQIQEDIGERIGFSKKLWQDKPFEKRASDVTNTLRRKKFVLLLDDIWDSKINLTALGVPPDTRSRIVFTTRSQGTCGEMGADKQFEVSYLRDDDAWKLFQRVVRSYVLDKHPDIPELAKAMASQCHGLPLALKTVGKAMASKQYPQQWTDAIETIRTSASKFKDLEKQVLSRLKFSYDSLLNDDLRSCLLYCCLFPQDSEIPHIDLIEFWKSEGFLDSNNGWAVLGDLVSACLLADAGDHVKMHDMIRDMALWIANDMEKEKENFLVCTGIQNTEAPNFEKWQAYKRISLMESGIQSLPEIPSCPRLRTLLLDQNCIKEIADGFFQSFPSLRVLSLSGNGDLTELPAGISNLVSLHHLDLSWTDIRGLPKELKALVNLRFLNLDYTTEMSRIPKQLISSFSKLQVLRMQQCGANSAEEGSVLSEDAEPLMKELLCLEHLDVVSLTLNGLRGIQILLNSQKLVRITQSLSIRFCRNPPLSYLNLAVMKHLKELQFMCCEFEEFKSTGEVRKVLSGFRSLHTVEIVMCRVKDVTWLAFLPKLRDLQIELCSDMEEIISVEKLSEVSEIIGELDLFAQLESLSILSARKLKCIYRDPLTLPKLKKIEATDCPELKKLPVKSSNAKEPQIVISGDKEWWDKLQWEDDATKNAFSTCFVAIEEE